MMGTNTKTGTKTSAKTKSRPDASANADAESGASMGAFADDGAQADTDSEMNRPFVVLHDKTTHGGVVITASENTFTDERRVARIGDLVSCPIPGHGVNPIVTASPYVEIDGRRVARHHDLTACGSLLLSSQFESSSE